MEKMGVQSAQLLGSRETVGIESWLKCRKSLA